LTTHDAQRHYRRYPIPLVAQAFGTYRARKTRLSHGKTALMVTPRTLDVKTRQKPSSQYTAYIKQKVNRTAVYMTDKAV